MSREEAGSLLAQAIAGALWHQIQGLRMNQPDDAEVAMVKRRKLVLVQALDQGDDACVNDSEPEVGVFALEGVAAAQVVLEQSLGSIGATD